ncbi:conserved hypothetical protein, YceG family [Rubidibacter lacunae KORDI 51-2]|uniref:Endolytic murein transglycosylase n=1 Tax=Rubidibacter lacunae KORDI 51-2 TaxID=582515 RepID=U5DR71_9CHRO|nr:endolytic transglycosylase MltG [Rubidibacter lacunae]ERN42190.1 conserved hypothetical protein, YceG family [Rubidibacter lacunae KORDI 51-2]
MTEQQQAAIAGDRKWGYVVAIARGLMLMLAVAATGAVLGWRWWLAAVRPIATDAPEVVYAEIPSGTAAQAIGEQLATRGLIRSPLAWRLWTLRATRWDKRSGGFQAGTYALTREQSLDTIADRIWRGDVAAVRFAVPEGRSRRQMAAELAALGFFNAEEFLAATERIPYDQFPWLPPELPHLEGFLFPDTYTLARDLVTPEAAIALMLMRFEDVALPLYERSDTDASLLGWVTLASIVEKEAVVAEERTLIAGVFANRLARGMRLEADPTVEYGLQIRQTVDRPLTLAQVRTPTPYNTYLMPGLPPTPIAAPGVASLAATLSPAETEYLFFVARYDGTHVFSRTLQEHLAAQRRIQQPQSRGQRQSRAQVASVIGRMLRGGMK